MARFVHLHGLTPYPEAHALLQHLIDARAADEIADVVLLLEHPPVITVGRKRGAMASVHRADSLPVIQVARGGDATLHAPGQLIAWPVIALHEGRRDLLRHLRDLESAVIGLLDDLGVQGLRDDRNTGVWLACPPGPPRKVCAVGIGARRWVTGHGLALNLTIDLDGFERLDPCGLPFDSVTRLADHLSPCPGPHALASAFAPYLARALDVPIEGPVHEVEAHERPHLLCSLRELGPSAMDRRRVRR